MQTTDYSMEQKARHTLWSTLAFLLVCLWLLGQTACRAASPQPPGSVSPPITTDQGKVGALLRAWAAEGSAAGNTGDWYDNRDREHSGLNLALWPQLQKVAYTAEERQRRVDWGAQMRVLPLVVFGNSSTSAGVHTGGSNARQLYTHPLGLQLLHEQYRRNNLYIYPEHLDYDPGHNGRPGYGDLYPTNTPYLFISQGSSGSDQPFMQALAFTLAAFRPEVKEKLVLTGMLMPTIQMIARTCNTGLTSLNEYLTGKAHPTVFAGHSVNIEKMVQMAHHITVETLPPVVQLQVLEEDEALNGQDFFDAPAIPPDVLAQRHPQVALAQRNLERYADTPAVIARIHRSRHLQQRMVVSAAESFDLNNRPLTYHWVVLRGESTQIQMRPLDAAGTRVEIIVPYSGRRPIATGSEMESNRVDIGVFVHNGIFYSAPAFLTFFSLDNEARTYDAQGRILEIGYGMGEIVVQVKDWLRFFSWIEPQSAGTTAQLLRALLPDTDRERLLAVASRYRQAREHEGLADHTRQEAEAMQARHAAAVQTASAARTAAATAAQQTPEATAQAQLTQTTQALEATQQAMQEADLALQTARQAHTAAQRAAATLLTQKEENQPLSVTEYVERLLQNVARQPHLLSLYQPYLEPLWQAASAQTRSSLSVARRKLAAWGVLQDSTGLPLLLTPLRQATPPSASMEERLTQFERLLISRFQAAFLTHIVFPEVVSLSVLDNYVDPRLSAAKSWRDLYHYDAQGQALGWTRFDGEQRLEFNEDGHLVTERDAAGRCVKARTVLYEREAATQTREGGSVFPNLKPLQMKLGAELVYYAYRGPGQGQRQEVRRESISTPPSP